MRKTYFANTVEEALQLARQELGDETLLVESRRLAPEEGIAAAYAVTVEAAALAPPAPPPPPAADPAPALERLARELAGLRQEVAGAVGWMSRPALLRAGMDARHSAWFDRLLAADVPAPLAAELLDEAGPPTPERTLECALLAACERRVACDDALGQEGAGPRAAAFLGPAGAGKTTALVKLAVQQATRARKPLAILSADSLRVGAAEQLRAYAAILGAPFQLLETPAALRPALAEFRNKSLILIDTPGFSRSDADLAEQWAFAFQAEPQIDCHLVLTATARTADGLAAAERWAAFRPAKLLFTRLDETAAAGGMLALAARTGQRLSYFSAGQRIPEDIEPARRGRLFEMLLGAAGAQRAAAA